MKTIINITGIVAIVATMAMLLMLGHSKPQRFGTTQAGNNSGPFPVYAGSTNLSTSGTSAVQVATGINGTINFYIQNKGTVDTDWSFDGGTTYPVVVVGGTAAGPLLLHSLSNSTIQFKRDPAASSDATGIIIYSTIQ